MTNQERLPRSGGRTKEQRELELLGLLETRAGRIQMWNLFARYRGTADGRMPPGGPVLIQVILAHEFPGQ